MVHRQAVMRVGEKGPRVFVSMIAEPGAYSNQPKYPPDVREMTLRGSSPSSRGVSKTARKSSPGEADNLHAVTYSECTVLQSGPRASI